MGIQSIGESGPAAGGAGPLLFLPVSKEVDRQISRIETIFEVSHKYQRDQFGRLFSDVFPIDSSPV